MITNGITAGLTRIERACVRRIGAGLIFATGLRQVCDRFVT